MRGPAKSFRVGKNPRLSARYKFVLDSTLRGAGDDGRGSDPTAIRPGKWVPRSMANWKSVQQH